jgi:hypothetical protein
MSDTRQTSPRASVSWHTTGRSYPTMKGAKRLKKDGDNQAQKLFGGKGPARTVKG